MTIQDAHRELDRIVKKNRVIEEEEKQKKQAADRENARQNGGLNLRAAPHHQGNLVTGREGNDQTANVDAQIPTEQTAQVNERENGDHVRDVESTQQTASLTNTENHNAANADDTTPQVLGGQDAMDTNAAQTLLTLRADVQNLQTMQETFANNLQALHQGLANGALWHTLPPLTLPAAVADNDGDLDAMQVDDGAELAETEDHSDQQRHDKRIDDDNVSRSSISDSGNEMGLNMEVDMEIFTPSPHAEHLNDQQRHDRHIDGDNVSLTSVSDSGNEMDLNMEVDMEIFTPSPPATPRAGTPTDNVLENDEEMEYEEWDGFGDSPPTQSENGSGVTTPRAASPSTPASSLDADGDTDMEVTETKEEEEEEEEEEETSTRRGRLQRQSKTRATSKI